MGTPRLINPLSAKLTKRKTRKVRRLLPTNCLYVFRHFAGLSLNELIQELPGLNTD